MKLRNPFKGFDPRSLGRVIGLLSHRGRFLCCLGLFCLIELGITAASTQGLRGVVSAVGAGNVRGLWSSLALLMGSFLGWWLYAPVSTYLCDLSSKVTVRELKTALCAHLVRLPQTWLDRKPAGELLSALTSDVDGIQQIYDQTFFELLRTFFGGIWAVVVMAALDWRMAIAVFSLGAISVLLSVRFSRRLEALAGERQERLARTSADAYELIRAAKAIRLLHVQERFRSRFGASADAEAQIRRETGRVSAGMNAAVTTVNLASYLLILLIGALLVGMGLSDWGTVLALTGLKPLTDMLFVEFPQFFAEMQKNLAGAKRVFSLLDEAEETAPSGAALSPLSGALSAKELAFSYGEGAPVLTDFSLELPGRGLTLLLGRSGSGKSTLLSLLLGLYPPAAGRITFSGEGEATLSNIRRQTAYVPQEAALFRGTIRENIACFREDLPLDAVREAARLSGAADFIEALPAGYETLLTDGGGGLSGGQRQRIAIARALAKKAPVLLLDEPTSALDPETEEQLFSTMRALAADRSVLMITHNRSAVRWADRTVALDARG